MPRRRPNDRCAICELTLAETGVRRLVATPSHQLRLCSPRTALGEVHHPTRTIRLRGNLRDVIVVFAGYYQWTDTVVHRVEATVYGGARPWFCQCCGHNSLCPLCKSPLTTAPMADYLDDDGRTVHSPSFTGHRRECPNPECDAHRTGIPNAEVTDWIDPIPFDPELERRVDKLLGDDDLR
jgi:hypothetical protein